MEKKPWSREYKLKVWSKIVVPIGVAALTLLSPAVRRFAHLEKKPEVASATTSQTGLQSTPQSQSSEPPKQEPQKATKKTVQKSTTQVTGDNNLAGNNVAGNSNIIGSNNTVYAAPQQDPKTATPVAGIHIASEKQVASADSDLPFGLEVVLVTDKDVSPTALKIRFSGEVGKVYGHPPGQMYTQAQGGIIVSSPNTVLVQWATPVFSVAEPVVLTLYSKTYIKSEKLESIPFSFPYAGQLK